MEKFKVGVWEEQSGYIYVEAKDFNSKQIKDLLIKLGKLI